MAEKGGELLADKWRSSRQPFALIVRNIDRDAQQGEEAGDGRFAASYAACDSDFYHFVLEKELCVMCINAFVPE